MKSSRAFVAPAFVAEREGTMQWMILVKSLTENYSLGIVTAGQLELGVLGIIVMMTTYEIFMAAKMSRAE